MFEHFDIVIQKSDCAEPYRCYYEQLDIDVCQIAKEKDRDEYGCKDNDAAHRRSAFFLQLAFESEVPDGFTDLFPLQERDGFLSHNQRSGDGDYVAANRPE